MTELGRTAPGATEGRPAPLAGIRVVEVASFVAAPSATAIMADLGAEIVKVEPLGGDPMWGAMRQARVPDGSANPDHAMQFVNRGKRSVALALDTAEGRDLLAALVGRCDVLIMNLLPRRRQRFGLDVERLRAEHADLVIGVLTGYGEQGDEIDRPGFDLTAYFARSGLVGLVPEGAGGPAKPRPGQGDLTAGLALFGGIMAALRARDLGGGGQVVEVSLLRTAMWTAGIDQAAVAVDGRPITPRGRYDCVSPLAEPFRCADGRWIQLSMVDPAASWPPFCRAIDRPDLVDHPRYGTPAGRFAHMRDLVTLLDGIFATRTRDDWGRCLDAQGCVWGPVNTPSDATTDPQVRAAGTFEVVDHPEGTFETVAAPFRLPGADAHVRGHYAGRGADTAAVLRSLLDLDEGALDRLRRAGAIAPGSAG